METFARVESIGSYNDVPTVQQGGLYVSALTGRWASPSSRALTDNLDAFSRAIEPSVLLAFSDDRVDDLSTRLNAEPIHMPILLITALHPTQWETLGSDDRFLQLRIGAFNGTAEAVRYLQKLSGVIADFAEAGRISSITWSHRRQQIMRLSKKVPVLNLAGLL